MPDWNSLAESLEPGHGSQMKWLPFLCSSFPNWLSPNGADPRFSPPSRDLWNSLMGLAG